jgi:RecB family exonuclease
VIIRRTRAPQLDGALDQVSPSRAAQLRSCELAVVFSADPAFAAPRDRGSTFATLGEICHELWEQEGRGMYDSVEPGALMATLNHAWDEAEARHLARLRESVAGDVPAPREWPQYLAKRLGVLSLIKRAVLERQARPRPDGPRGASPPARIEAQIDAGDVPLRGRPDRVKWEAGAAHIYDLKTCAAGDEMSEEHRRQLLAYAYLWHAEHGDWPARGTIQYVGGEQHTIDIDPREADEVVTEMIASLATLNDRAGAGSAESLAQPSPDACRWCSFRAACAPFYERVTVEWGLYDRNVIGTVERVESSPTQSAVILSDVRGDLGAEIGMVTVTGLEAGVAVSIGERVAVAGAQATRSPSTIRCTWESVVCIWDP